MTEPRPCCLPLNTGWSRCRLPNTIFHRTYITVERASFVAGEKKMGEYLLGLFVLILAVGGIYRVKQAFSSAKWPILCVAIEEQEACLECIIRYLLRQIRLLSANDRLLLLVRGSDDETNIIVQQLAKKMFFDFCLVQDENIHDLSPAGTPDKPCRLFDLRGQKSLADLRRSVQKILQ